MSDVQDIQTLINMYSDASGPANWDQLVATFTEDGSWELLGTPHKMKGHKELRAGFPALAGGMEYLVQTNTPAIIEVSGNTATARSTIRESGKVKGKEHWVEILGKYEDKLVKTPKGWRFTHRAFTLYGVGHLATIPNAKMPGAVDA